MSSFSLAPASSLDRFDDGHARLDLPIRYDDYFRLLANLSIFANADTAVGEDGERRIQLDSVFVKLILEWGYALARKISAASYGGAFPDGQADPLILRAGSMQALGVPIPPLFQLFRRFENDGFPFSRPLSEVDYIFWIQVIRDNANSTRDWLADAQERLFIFGKSSGWDFDAATFHYTNLISLHAQVPLLHLLRIIAPHTSQASAVIPHPVLGSGAENALVPYSYAPLLNTRPLPENPCRDVIPHPIYGPDANNSLVVYQDRANAPCSESATRRSIGQSIERPRAPTPWSACGSPIQYPDSEPASPMFDSPGSPAIQSEFSESISSGTSDSSVTPSDYSGSMGHFTVYEPEDRSDVDSNVSWERVSIDGGADEDYIVFQAAVERALYEARGTRYDPIDLTE